MVTTVFLFSVIFENIRFCSSHGLASDVKLWNMAGNIKMQSMSTVEIFFWHNRRRPKGGRQKCVKETIWDGRRHDASPPK